MPDLEIHPFAMLFPEMDGEQFDRLLEDMITNGQQDPIILFEGKILDGRNRYRALMSIRAESIATSDFDGTEMAALRFVASKNLSRRHMNASQRAAVGAAILEMMREHPSLSETLKTDEHAFHSASNLEKQARAWIERPGRDPIIEWPPARGFLPTAPETLKAFARSNGVENVSLVAEGDEREVDQDKLLDVARSAGVTDEELPKDEPAPEKCAVDWSAVDSFAPVGAKPKNSGGRPRNKKRDTAEAFSGISRRTAQRLERVVENAAPEVRAAVAAGTLSVRRAEEIATLPHDEQAAAVSNKATSSPNNRTRQTKPLIAALYDISNNVGDFIAMRKPQEINEFYRAVAATEAALRPHMENING